MWELSQQFSFPLFFHEANKKKAPTGKSDRGFLRAFYSFSLDVLGMLFGSNNE